jgi:hypothetical protein
MLSILGDIKLLKDIGLRRDMLGHHVKKFHVEKFTIP